MNIVIPSHRRAGHVTTHRYIENAVVCIPEGQLKQYARYHEADTLVCHPDSVVGIGPKRQWIYEHFKECVMLDDDCKGFHRLTRIGDPKLRSGKVSAARAYDIVCQTAELCRSMGGFLFGWGKDLVPTHYDQYRPFRFGPWVGGAIGILAGSGLHWPKSTLSVEDAYVNLLNAHVNRFMVLDQRFAWEFERWKNAGGMMEFRQSNSDTHHRDSYRYVSRFFGEDAVRTKQRPPDPMNDESYLFYVQLPFKV